MKFLHTSDWHLGMTFRAGVSYAEDQKFAIDNILKTAEEEKADAILLAGDIFDKSIASPEALRLYDETVTRICGDLDIPVYLIAGNHDSADRISQCSSLLKKSGLFIAGALNKDPFVFSQGDTDIYLLPWISTDKVKSVFPDKADNVGSMEDAYRVVMDVYRASFKKGRKKILLAHAFAGNAETSVSDRAAEVGKATMITTDVFDGFDYVALGHLHGPQNVKENIRYSGSPMAYSFGKEEKQVKSVTIIDTDSMEIKIVPIPQLRKRVTLKGTFDELLKGEYDEDILKGYVRLEVTDSFVGIEAMAALREVYINLLEVSGKGLEKEDAKITMTIDEFEEAGTDPEYIFSQYCRDMLDMAPGEHLAGLFRDAVKDYEKEMAED